MTEHAVAHATALLVLWNDVDAGMEAAYHDWHANEHVPERLTVPGILWGRRYADAQPEGRPRYLTLYGLRDTGVLDSAPYRRLLSHPTPASARMRPALRNLTRWVCTLHDDAPVLPLPGDAPLALWTCEDEAAVRAVQAGLRSAQAESRCWRAARLEDAAPLPWLTPGHRSEPAAAPSGRWLIGAAWRHEQPASTLGARLYRPLPVAPTMSAVLAKAIPPAY
jgi:hypothetical protein